MGDKYDIEKGLISSLIQTKDMALVKELQIRPSFFTGNNKRVFQYITTTVLNSGEVPTVGALERKFPDYELLSYDDKVGTEESLRFWCVELRNKVKHNNLADALEDAVKKMGKFETEEALDILKHQIMHIESEVNVTQDVDITKDTQERKERYLERKQNQGMLGISYGIPQLDYMTGGAEDGTLIVLIANTGVGKTWFEVILGASMQLQNVSVMQCVTEMSEEIMRDRYEAVLFSQCYGDLNYNQFKKGKLSINKEREFFTFLEDDLPNLEPLIITTATGVMKLESDIKKYDPDIIFIDGVYLMEDDQGAKDDWLRVAHITRDLKKLAKRVKKPIFINTQADKNTSKKTGPELGSIMFTQAIGQDADVVMTLYRDPVMIADGEMMLKNLKVREGNLGKMLMNWDFTTMNFGGIYAEVDEDEDEDEGFDKSDEELDNSKSKSKMKDNTLKGVL